MDKRYVVGLQKKTDVQCYVDFFESDTFIKAQEAAELKAKEEDRTTIIFDRNGDGVVFKFDPKKPIEEIPKEKKYIKRRIKRK